MACAPTGSGKTLAFVLPLLHHLKGPENRGFRGLVLAPTRELAEQVLYYCFAVFIFKVHDSQLHNLTAAFSSVSRAIVV